MLRVQILTRNGEAKEKVRGTRVIDRSGSLLPLDRVESYVSVLCIVYPVLASPVL